MTTDDAWVPRDEPGIDSEVTGPGEAPEQEGPSIDYTAWERAGVIQPDADPWETRQALEFARAVQDPDTRGLAVQQLLSAGEAPIIPPGMTLQDVQAAVHAYLDGGGDDGGFEDPEAGFYGEPEDDGFSFDQGVTPQQVQAMIQQAITEQQQQLAAQAQMYQAEQEYGTAFQSAAASHNIPPSMQQAFDAHARALVNQAGHLPIPQAVQLAAEQFQQGMMEWAAGLGQQTAAPMPPPEFMPQAAALPAQAQGAPAATSLDQVAAETVQAGRAMRQQGV